MAEPQNRQIPPRSREAFALFADADTFDAAVSDLLQAGYDQRQLSVLAEADTVERKLGTRFAQVTEIRENDGIARTGYIDRTTAHETKAMALGALGYAGAMTATGAVVVNGGTVIAAGLAAVAAGGGTAAVGEGLSRLVRDEGFGIQRKLEAGNIALWVTVANDADEADVKARAERNGAESVGAHWVELSDTQEDNPLAGKVVDPFLKYAKI